MVSCNLLIPMRRPLLLVGLLVSFAASSLIAQDLSTVTSRLTYFTENRGQVVDASGAARPDILYSAIIGNVAVHFTEGGPTFEVLSSGTDATARQITLQLANANSYRPIRVEEQAPAVTNYYLPHCPDGILGVRSWRRLVYEDVYPNIDMVFAIGAGGMRAEFVLRPNALLSDIKYVYYGNGRIHQDQKGAIGFDIPMTAPEMFQGESFSGEEIISSHGTRLENGNVVIPLFETIDVPVTAPVAAKRATDDPTIAWATYLGGEKLDYGTNIAGDVEGNVIVTGYTTSTSFPTTVGAYQTSNAGPYDIFVAKLDRYGEPVWITYYGGTGSDIGHALAVDGNRDIVVAGQAGDGFPVSSGAFQTTAGGKAEAFVLKLDRNGARLWATYYGGAGNDIAHNLAIDPSGNVLLSGRTASQNFPVTAGAVQSTLGGAGGTGVALDGFLVKFSGTGSRLWATYYGGSKLDYCYGVASDSSGNVFLAGSTASDDLPVTPGAFQIERADSAGFFGANDGFLCKFSPDGTRQWATYFGGWGDDFFFDIAADRFGDVVAIGSTLSTDLPVTPGAIQPIHAGSGNNDAMIVKFSGNGQRLWATYYGGTQKDDGQGVAIASNGGIVIAGNTSSTDLKIATSAVQETNGGGVDLFIAQISSAGEWQWASYFGGGSDDRLGIGGVGIDTSGSLLMTGYTSASGFPVTTEAFQSTYGGDAADAIVVKLEIPIVNPPGSVPVFNAVPEMVAIEAITPNPATDVARLRFRLSLPQEIRLVLYAADGTQLRVPISSEIRSAGEHFVAVDLRGLASGIYLVELSTPRGRSVASIAVVQ